ncbi:adenine nucleotide alpha hydrolases-like protein [Hypoxylon sp. FL0890]|nr:adenine nucleotide alpha hydrolases-like protein [Hypoxylon sp. FL0890]
MAADGPLNVIALISGGKDSFYSIFHCLANGHRVVALANLHPSPRVATTSRDNTTPTSIAEVEDGPRAEAGTTTNTTSTTIRIFPGDSVFSQKQHGSPSVPRAGNIGDEEDEADLNSFMYQTVGHQVIPLYAKATGLPLFRQPILGTAVDNGISYYGDPDGQHPEDDETESLIPLLRAVLKEHPEVNALCTGAILSTYQRTRIESVALRLGLIPLAYLWQFPELPLPSGPTDSDSLLVSPIASDKDDGQLLRDMAAARLEARIVKVASAGLDEGFLWENVASETTLLRIRRALRRFGSANSRGAVLGEGGEFETLVLDGPPALFRGRIVVHDEDRRIVREGGGSAWLNIRKAEVEPKADEEVTCQTTDLGVRIPGLFDKIFEGVLHSILNERLVYDDVVLPQSSASPLRLELSTSNSQDWYFVGRSGDIEIQTTQVVNEISHWLHERSLTETAITNSVIVLRRMTDFPTVNRLYGALFQEPNPPSRVTISCGDLLLPRCADICILITVQPRMKKEDRHGLHVQSRSYWAPANIGPYSQAVAYPLFTSDESQSHNDGTNPASPLAVSIAGQIPLVPASMSLPSVQPDGSSILPLQVTLALQHLWRVGTEMQVQWWSSAVAYFPRSLSSADARSNALLASSAWKVVHESSFSASSIDAAEILDPWDRKYNSAYTTYGDTGDDTTSRPALPDWEVLKDFDADTDVESGGVTQKPLPFVFSAEVEELPRSAGVEWHAHLGFANLGSGSIRFCSEVRDGRKSQGHIGLHHVVVESSLRTVFVQTVAAYEGTNAAYAFADAMDCIIMAVKRSLGKALLGQEDSIIAATINPKLTYVTGSFVFPEDMTFSLERGAVIPCRSLWDYRGNSLDMVSIYETRWVNVR